MCVHVYVCVYICVCVWRSEEGIIVFHIFSPMLQGQGLFLNGDGGGANVLARLEGRKPSSPPICISP